MGTEGELDGRYRLRQRLGAGGMSVVWRAEDRVLGRDVAVKLLGPAFAQTARHRMRAEARAVARLAHPHIAAVYDYGEAPGEDGRPVPYVVMELVAGPSLAQRLAAGPLPWHEAVAVTAEVADALVAAHRAGVVHRDVTPANILLGPNGVKVVDFGIAAAAGERESGTPLGTPAYLAPERLEGHGAQPATDVYALGLLLYQALTGSLPWPAETTTGMLRAHRYTPPAPLPPVPGLPGEVAELCAACLAKDPADRPDAATVAARLGALAGGHTTRMIAAGMPLDAAPATGNPGGAPATGSPGGGPLTANAGGGPATGSPAAGNPGTAAPVAGLAATRALPVGRPGAVPAGVAAVPSRPAPAPAERFDQPGRRPVRRSRLLPVLAVVALATAAAVVAGLVGTSHSTRTPEAGPTTPAPAAAATTTAGAACAVDVSTAVERGKPVTSVTVTNTGPAALSGWTLTFRSSGTLDGSPGEWSRDGDRVTVRSGDGLGAGERVTLRAEGGGHGKRGVRLDGFALNGVGCTAGGDMGDGGTSGDGGDG